MGALEFLREKKEAIAKGAAVLTAGALGFAACNWVIGDEYPHPAAGRVDQISEPSRSCYYDKFGKHCSWHYYIFVNGCVDLPPEVDAYVEDKGREPEYGWVEVSPDTWSHSQQGDIITFEGRNIFQRILADQRDDNHPCPE